MLVYSISLVVKYVHVRTERYMYIRYVLVHHQITWLYMYTYCTIMCIYMYMYNHVHFLCICFVAGDEGSERHRTAQCKAPRIHWGTASDHHWEASWTAGEKIAPILSSQLLFIPSVILVHIVYYSCFTGIVYPWKISFLFIIIIM